LRTLISCLLGMIIAAQAVAEQNFETLGLASFEQQNIVLDVKQHKVTYVDFWASWCKPCVKSFPFMNKLHDRYAKDGLKIVAINMDEDIEDASVFLKKHQAQFAVYRDPDAKLAERFKVSGLPISYLIDSNGKLMATHTGFNERKAKKLEQQISYLLAQ
jgi:thiol-disulfide isomerase/thioredoxin